jgi:RHS repeat-associated protein
MGMAGRSMAWAYGTERQRVQNVVTDSSVTPAVTRTIHYLHPDRTGGLFYERQSNGSTVEHRHFITAGDGVIGVVKTFGEGNATVAANPDHVNYWHKDPLGSVVAVTNASGAVLERMAYDAWGKRLNANGTTDPNGVLNPASTDRGFTGHEHLDELGFVHMNGRIYDPLLGRFLSPDPHIQAEDLLQNYNRYSYVLNNPLRYTDPSGEFWNIVAFIVGAALASSDNKDLKIIGSIMMMAALGPGVTAEPGLLHLAAGAEKLLPAVVSFASAAIANTIAYGPEAGIKAGLFAAAFTGAGGIPGELSPQRIMAHALLGCLQQATSGGQCGPGAAAAAFGKIATGLTGGIESGLAQFAITTVVGGTASVIGGGKFANGAAQAGFGYLFNDRSGAAAARAGSPSLEGDPYHPDSVRARQTPPYEANPEHGDRLRPNKTPEPADSRAVYERRAVRVAEGRWIGRSESGAYYQYFNNNRGVVHFSGVLSVDQVRQYGYASAINRIDARAHVDSLTRQQAQPSSSWRTAPPSRLGRY